VDGTLPSAMGGSVSAGATVATQQTSNTSRGKDLRLGFVTIGIIVARLRQVISGCGEQR
jgi:hypothetical protein